MARHTAPSTGSSPVVGVIPWRGSDAELVGVLLEGDARAGRALYERFGDDVNRVVWKLLGADEEHDDVVQQVFLAVLDGLDRLRDPAKLKSWIVGVAVYTVRAELRRRRVRRLVLGGEPPDIAVDGVDHESRSVLRRVYAVLDKLPTDERIAFVLRRVDQRSLPQVAEACRCSLATIKRRLARADARFQRRVRNEPDIIEWLNAKGDPSHAS